MPSSAVILGLGALGAIGLFVLTSGDSSSSHKPTVPSVPTTVLPGARPRLPPIHNTMKQPPILLAPDPFHGIHVIARRSPRTMLQ